MRPILIALLLAGLSQPARVWADAFSMTLEVSCGAARQSATTQSDAPRVPGAIQPPLVKRPLLQVAAGEKLTAKWKAANTGPQPAVDVLVHFYVVRIEKPGQAPPPLEPHEVVIETAGTMDLPPAGSTSAELQFLPDRAGAYLVRIEIPVSDQGGQAHYAAIDLVVK